MKTDQAIVEIVLKGQQANATLKDIERSASALRAQLKRLPADSQEFADKSKELQKVNTRLQSIREDLKATGRSFSDLSKQVLQNVTAYTIVLTIITKVWQVIKNAVNTQREFEKSLKNLSAITGATGKDLEYFKNKAIEMGVAVEGGAKAVVEAIKLIGSAKPELLANKEALVQVTEAAILLSHAAGMELPDAATRLTDAMNQFGAPAMQAAKYVDALAAAAKYGAAEVPDITDALLKFGTSAKSSNIDIYESAAAIELLAEKGLKGADAGTALRNIFTKLSAADVLPPMALEQLTAAGVNINVLKDKTIPLNDRLKELSKIAGNASAIFKVFGEENKNAGEIIISNLPRLQELTTQIHETGVASTQAATNMDTFDQSVVEAGSTWDKFILSLTSGKVSGIMKTIVEGWTDSLDRFSQLLMGTYNKTEDIISLSMVKDHGGISPEQAKRLVEFGFAVDFSNGKIDKQRLWLLDLIKVTDLYVNSLEGVNNNEVKRKLLINQLAQEKEKLIAFNKAGIMSKADMDAGLRLITDQLKKVQALKDQELHKNTNTNAPLVKDDKAKKKFEEDQAAFWRRIEELRKEASLYSLSEIEKDKAKEFDAYQKVLDDIEKAQKEGLIKGVEIDRAKQAAADHHYKKLREIDEKYMHKFNADTEQNLKEYNDFTNQQRQNEINDVMAQYDKLMVLAADDAQKQIELKQALDQKLAEIDKKYSVSPIGATPDMTEFDKYKDLVNKYSNHLGTIAAIDDNFAQVKANKIQKEQAAADAQTQNDLDREKRLLDMKIISQKTYDERVKSIEAQKQNRDRLAANKQMANQKNAARFSAALNFVEMESKTLAHYGLTPEAAIAMAVGAALEISKMAVINSQEIPPQYAGGGLHDPNGYVNSETMFSSSSGQPFIAGERGAEWIAPSWMLNEPVIANQIGILEAVRQRGRGFVSGGSTQTAPVPSFAGGGSTNTGISQSNAQLVAVISRLSEQIDRGIGVNYDLLTKTTKSIENAKNGSAVN